LLNLIAKRHCCGPKLVIIKFSNFDEKVLKIEKLIKMFIKIDEPNKNIFI